MLIVLDMTLVVSAMYMAISYLYFIKYIRIHSDDLIDNLNVINFIVIYKKYILLKKNETGAIGPVFYLHLISILIVLVLGYYMDGTNIIYVK